VRLRLVITVFTLLVAAICGPAAAAIGSPPAPAHVTGWVRAGPTCPVERPGRPCLPRPVAATKVQVRSLSGRVVATTRTKADGYYSVQLLPGRYVLVVETVGMFPRCPHVRVLVPPQVRVMRADVNCDTGIR